METLQKLSVPIAIVIAGALIAGAVFYVNLNGGGGGGTPTGEVAEEIRGVQADDHILGNPNADLVIVEFSDTECPFCKEFHNTMHRLVAEYGADGNFAWVYRHFPLDSLHPKAPKQAEALECAAEQGGSETFWKYTDLLYSTTQSNNSLDIGVYNTPSPTPTDASGQPYYVEATPRSATDAGKLSDMARSIGLDVAKFESCLQSGKYKDRVEKDFNEAVAAGGRGTPHSILIVDGEQIPIEGAQSYETIKGLLDAML